MLKIFSIRSLQIRGIVRALALLALTFFVSSAQAQFTINTSGNWEDSGIWQSGNIADGINDNVDFSSNLGNVDVNADYTVGNINMNNGNSLTINSGYQFNLGNSSNFKTLDIGNNSTIIVEGDLELWGNMIVSNSLILTVNGNMIIRGDANINNNAIINVQGDLSIDGNMNVGTNTDFNIDGVIEIGGTLNAGNGSTIMGSGVIASGNCSGDPDVCNSPQVNPFSSDCDVDFPGTSVLDFTGICGTGSDNLELGKNTPMGNGDVFTFNAPSIIGIGGSVNVNASGDGTIIIPAGVRVEVAGNFQLDDDGGCEEGNECTFTFIVEGELVISGNLQNNLKNLVWEGAGSVSMTGNLENSSNGCMSCGTTCPAFPTASGCSDDGDGCGSDFCTDGNYGSSTPITSVDNTPPVFTGCPTTVNVTMSTGCTQQAFWTEPVASDNVGVVSEIKTHSPGDMFPLGTTPVTYTASDAAGNTTICSFNVTVNDTGNPTYSNCPTDITVNNDGPVAVNWTAPTAADNCSVDSENSTHTSGDVFPVGTTTVTYTAFDAAGNSGTCTFNVTVVDNVAPVISGCPADITSNLSTGCDQTVSWTEPTQTGAITFTSTHSPGDVFPFGTTTVTYTADDGLGNVSTCSFDITVNDTGNPTYSNCPTDITVNNDGPVAVNWTAPTAADNCSVDSENSTHTSGDVFPVGTTTVTYTAFDAAGNSGTCTFNVTVVDNVAPVISGCPADITSNLSIACDQTVSWTEPTQTGAITFTSTHSPGDVFPFGTTTVTYTADDGLGNVSTCSFDITVNDSGNPTYSNCPTDMTVNNDGPVAVNWTAPTASDNCSVDSENSTHTSGDVFPVGTTTVTYTAFDAAGNSGTCTFNVTVVDNVAPVISGCPADITSNLSTGCDQTVSWTEPTQTGAITFTSTHTPGDVFPFGTTTVTYTADDGLGNVSTCSFDITVNDTGNPTYSNCPTDITVNNDGPVAVNWTAPTASDNCSVDSENSTHTSGDVFPVGTTTVTYTAFDAAGNSGTCTFNVTVVDNVAPVISGCPADITSNLSTGCDQTVSWTEPTQTGAITFTSTHGPGDVFPFGTTTVTYTADDGLGNVSTCSFDITVNDVGNPSFTGCPGNQNASMMGAACAVSVIWTPPVATDNCTVNVVSTHNPGDNFTVGTTTVTYTATDDQGNSTTCTFDVIVTDDSNPVFAGCPGDITQSTPGAVFWTEPSATDNCGPAIVSTSLPSGSVFGFGSTVVTYSAADNYGNVSICSFTVTIQDADDPVINNCPSDISVSAGATCDQVVNWTEPTAVDNQAINTFSSTYSSGDTFPLGTTTVTYTATDDTGNTATCSFDVTVVDDSSPVVSMCPGNISMNNDGAIAINWVAPGFSDNCGIGSITSSHNSGDVFLPGTTTVIYQGTDVNGNKASCTFDITITDDVAPLVSGCPSNMNGVVSAGCMGTMTWTEPVFTDGYGISMISRTHSPGDNFPLGTTTVTYTATDWAGNMSSCSFDVTLTDATPPVFTSCPPNQNLMAAGPQIVTWTSPVVSEDCGISSIVSTHNSGDLFPLGSTAVIYTATDNAGLTATCSFTVTITDTGNPVINGCPSDITAEAASGCGKSINWTEPTATDADGISSFISSHNPGDNFPVGTTLVTYTAEDNSGNSTVCSFNITVLDTIAPTFVNCPADKVISSDGPTSITWTAPLDTDNCGSTTLVESHAPGSIFPVGVSNVSYTSTDPTGNSRVCGFMITIVDDVPPVITGCPSDILINMTSGCNEVVTWTPPAAVDGGGVVSFVSTHVPGEIFPAGSTTVTYTATDASGNITTCSFDVIVDDTTAPVISNIPADIASSVAEVSWTVPVATDNCSIASFTSNYNPGDSFAQGTTTVIYTATDASGNITNAQFNVTVSDDEAPVISNCPTDITLSPASGCTEQVFWTEPTATDNVSVVMTSNANSGDVFGMGTTVVEYTATDPSGNTTTCSFAVTLLDQEDPTVSGCPADLNISNTNPGSCNIAVNWTEPVFNDNCGITNLSQSHSPGDMFTTGTTTVVYTAEDASGNQVVCSFNIIVTDDSPPEFTLCPANITRNRSEPVAVSWDTPEVNENCDFTITSTHNSGDVFPVGTTTVTYTATDNSGNATTCSFTVTVTGNNRPEVDPVFVQTDGEEPLEICLNASDPDGDNLVIADIDYDPVIGEIYRQGDQSLCFFYEADIDFAGLAEVTVRVCDDGSPSACRQTIVQIEVTPDREIVIYKAITPDLDGFNDLWVIENIERYPDNYVRIFDQWGSVVYEANGYNNSTVVWDGTGNTGTSRGSQMPTSTYFYLVEIKDQQKYQGYVELIR